MTPDVYILGKALSGGFYPVSAVVSRRDVLGVFGPGSHGSTFGGNPLGCAVAREAMRVLHDEQLVQRSATEGAWLLEQLRSPAASGHSRRSWDAASCAPWSCTSPAATSTAKRCSSAACSARRHTAPVIRLSPPLVVARRDLEWAVEQFRAVFTR
ncbi:aminotransferase class III-fold pyridoxal phosphate-dependent enzyme [Gemmatimonas sp.]|uniref:aminotransferase class III-fold pyridoxal phosphate-dependent enzyme n=1 Tax=Gemmatimonas sp. TaxID=1962908 RepID=UPI003DA479F1